MRICRRRRACGAYSDKRHSVDYTHRETTVVGWGGCRPAGVDEHVVHGGNICSVDVGPVLDHMLLLRKVNREGLHSGRTTGAVHGSLYVSHRTSLQSAGVAGVLQCEYATVCTVSWRKAAAGNPSHCRRKWCSWWACCNCTILYCTVVYCIARGR